MISSNLLGHRVVAIVFASALLASVSSPAKATSDALENLASVLASKHVCGFSVNEQMVEVSINALFGDPRNVAPGGKHWPEMQRNMARIKTLTQTTEGHQSFCQSVKRNLSAFLD